MYDKISKKNASEFAIFLLYYRFMTYTFSEFSGPIEFEWNIWALKFDSKLD